MNPSFHFTGQLGRLQTATIIPVVAGDSIEITMQGWCRMAPLKRQLQLDAVKDIFIVYQPLRHYHSNWDDLILDGWDESVTLTSGTAQGATSTSYLGSPKNTWENVNVPLRISGIYNDFWDWFMRVRGDETNKIADHSTLHNGSSDERKYGKLCARLPAAWTRFMEDANLPGATDREVDTTGDKLDLVDLAKQKGRYESEILREYFAHEYTDIIDTQFGGSVNADAEPKPTLLWHDRDYMSGIDIDGTGDTSLGTYVGKSAGAIQFHMPRKFIPEHGQIAIFQVVRYPTVHDEECHFLHKLNNPSYEEISGDPDILRNSEPVDLEIGQVFGPSTSTTVLGKLPAGWYYRDHPSYVHEDWSDAQGVPFMTDRPTDMTSAYYHVADEYANTFQSEAFGHWRTDVNCGITKYSVVPPAISSLYAGI